MKKITKAVIAVAGYGTRFLPATKNLPKEMLPIVDKPIIQYLVEEAINSGIKDIILVTRNGQSALENHFDSNYEIEEKLKLAGKTGFLKQVRNIPRLANFVYVRQGRFLPYGNATPLLCVKNLINPGESFVYMFGDDMVMSEKPCVRQLINAWKQRDYAPQLAVQKVDESEVNRYGIIKLESEKTCRVVDAVEKPSPENAPRPFLAQFGRFILNDDIIKIAYNKYKKNELGKGEELWLIDCVLKYAKSNPVYAKKIVGRWMTTGDPLRYMQTQVEYALKRGDIGKDFKKYLNKIIK